MKKVFGVLLVSWLILIIAAAVFARGIMAETTEGQATQPYTMGYGMMRMLMGQHMMSGINNGNCLQSDSINPMDFHNELGLTKDQQKKVNSILASHRKDIIRKNADREIAETELYELIQQERPDQVAIDKQIRKIADMEAEIRYSEIKSALDTKLALTEEQWNTLKNIQNNKDTQETDNSGIGDYPG